MLPHDCGARGVVEARDAQAGRVPGGIPGGGKGQQGASKRVSLLRRCALPAPKTFAGYDWSAVTWPEGLDRDSLLSLAFLDAREDLVLMGDVGTGKTHMASALCALACERRIEARFFTASSLVARLRRARRRDGWTGRPRR